MFVNNTDFNASSLSESTVISDASIAPTATVIAAVFAPISVIALITIVVAIPCLLDYIHRMFARKITSNLTRYNKILEID